MSEEPISQRLLSSSNPSIRYLTRTKVLGENEGSPSLQSLRAEIKDSEIARRLLSHRRPDGTILTAPARNQTNVYQKWQGPHWTLVCLAAIGYPPGDGSLRPLLDQSYAYLLADRHLRFPHSLAISGQDDRFRRCAGQEGQAVIYSYLLGLADERTEELVRRLKQWQWPDGGWNCDKRPEARTSSFHESLIPMRALALHARLRGDHSSRDAAARAAEVFLKRRLFRRQSDGRVIDDRFLRLRFPQFYFYDILFGLKVMAEAGFLGDERCREALDLLESKRLPDGGFPLEKKEWHTAEDFETRGTFAEWGPAGGRRSNEFVTVEALSVLRQAGRRIE